MPYLINESIGLFLNKNREEILIKCAEAFNTAIIFDPEFNILTESLRKYYSGIDSWDLLLLFNDNYNSLMIGEGSTKKDNEASFLVRNKVAVLAEMLLERMNEPGFPNKIIPNYQQA